ncbi:sulfotransferase family protein [Mycolicibacterium diernhoferi]|uniref:Sulfotransferase n=1 Tax=Mycolicibacterium diernhoferi TaxID=1801 RepID=A0A1Q4HJQ3_9MYCO|nr:sulfotransferase [Mycolicibacterium diernhoferi]OJZ67760.1 sulfotransferase family protein [Mycolicibacterium diernhoferi]OPE52366.1 sulfotransferase family protein [Mycolicibacterium diernhoferi]PEG51666.1 sulfotransferase [Mycolicibacterium diernhoferi]QYL20408.1 sulfotransferase [Mycolicibacterium diernhoferi]
MNEFDSISTPDDVLKLASRRTGLVDIDSDSWREGLAIVLDEVNSSPAFTPAGRERIIDDAAKALERRLKVHDYIQRHPEVLDTPVERPIFTLGMPRTGTTVISYLLDQDPNRRSLLHWECMTPVPPPATGALRTDPRCLALLEEQKQILELVRAAKMPLPHWEDADGPTECMFIHNQDFKGLSWDAFLASPRYARWLINEADMTSAYEYQKRYLQVLQSKAPGTWSLKMPSHSVYIDTLLQVFPDARFIWAHRDPFKATGSLGNLLTLPKSMVLTPEAQGSVDWATNLTEQMSQHVARPLRSRERIGDDRFFDMYYHEMMNDPMDVIRRIYEWLGDPFDAETEAGMRNWLAAHPQDRFGQNAYTLDEYGLTVEGLTPIFADYLEKFDIEMESAL